MGILGTIAGVITRDLEKASTTFFSVPKCCNTFDIDGVIFINREIGGVYPGPNDIIITGRSIEEAPETKRMLAARGIRNEVFYNCIPFIEKNRTNSGRHKGTILNMLIRNGYKIGAHFEDDEVQAVEIKLICTSVPVILLVHELTNKENVRRLEY